MWARRDLRRPGLLLLLALVGIVGSATPLAAAQPARVVSRGDGSQRAIALTFDDGWDAKRCKQIAAILDEYEVPATWFPNAVYVAGHPEIWRSIAARFPIANHTANHLDLTRLSDADIRSQIGRSRTVIEKVTGQPMAPLLRPPFGAYNERVLRIARELGFPTAVMWDVTSADTATRSKPWGMARAASRGRAGSIVLMHCGPKVTPKILPAVIAHYACKGFRFATVEELLAGGPGQAARVECPGPQLPRKSGRRGGSAAQPTDLPMPQPTAMPQPDAIPAVTTEPPPAWPAVDLFAPMVESVRRLLGADGADAPA